MKEKEEIRRNGVLIDETTILKSSELLEGAKPSFENVFALSNLVEGLILHNQLFTITGPGTAGTHEMAERTLRAKRKVGKGFISPVPIGKYAYEKMFKSLDEYFLIKDPAHRKYYQSIRREFTQDIPLDAVKYCHDTTVASHGSTMREYRAELKRRIKHKEMTPNAFLDILVDLDALKRDFDWGPPEKDHHDVHVDDDTWAICQDIWGKFFSSIGHLDRMVSLDAYYYKLIARTLFYYYAMLDTGIPYKPDANRMPLVRAYANRSKNAVISITDRAIELLGEEKLMAEGINSEKILGYDSVSGKFPFLLNVILSNSNKPSDILDNTLSIRTTNSARRLRQWATKAQRHSEEARGLPVAYDVLNQFSEDISDKKEPLAEFEAIQISALPLSYSIGRVTASPRGLMKMCKFLSNHYRLAFLYKMPKQVKFSDNLNDNLNRLFGQKLDSTDQRRLIALYNKMYSS